MQTTTNYGLKKPEGTDVVNIDDLNTNADTIDTQLKKINDNAGALSGLKTTAKTTLVAAINEVFQSGADVKSGTISAVNNKGASLDDDATWDDIVAAINAIARGQGNAVESQVLSGATFSNADGVKRTGTMPNKGAITITPSGSAQTIPAGYHNGSGKVSAVTVPVANVLSGTTIAGQAGTMPNKGAVTITPGAADKTIDKGYHNGSGKVVGDANLSSSNIKAGKSIFGVVGTVEEKQEFSTYLANLPATTYTPVSYIDGEGLYCYKTGSSNKTLYLFNSSGTIIKTIVNPSTHTVIYPFYINDQYVLWGSQALFYLDITDKNGTLLHEYSTSDQNSVMAACILNGQLYVFVGGYHLAQVRVYDMSFNEIRRTDCGVGDTMSWIYCFIPMKTGVLIYGNGDEDFISFVTTEGVGKCIYDGTIHSDHTSFAQIFNTCFKLN